MDFNPNDVTEQGPQLAEGWHTLEILEATEKISSTGNPMIVLEYGMRDAGGQPGAVRVREHLVATRAALWKVQQVMEHCGLAEQFNRGRTVESDFRGRHVRVELGTESVEGYDRPLLRVVNYDDIPCPQPAAAAPPAARVRDQVAHPGAPTEADPIPF